MRPRKSKSIENIRGAVVNALVAAGTVVVLAVVRYLLSGLFDGNWRTNWADIFEMAAIFGLGWFVTNILLGLLTFSAYWPVEDVFAQYPSQSSRQNAAFTGFVAIEYYGLILNRTFVVFVAPEGLYGWKARGPVTGTWPLYFQPLVEMLHDPEWMRNRDAITNLSKRKGGFFIPRSAIVAADIIRKKKWGMGAIPHSGRIRIVMSEGRSREFILLGSVNPDLIQQNILSGALLPVPAIGA